MSTILRMKRGDEFTFDVDVTKDGAPFDLTNSRVHFFLKDSRNDADPPLIKKSTVLGGINVLNAINGKVRITLAPADTLVLTNKTKHYDFDVTVKERDGSVFSVLCAELIIAASVSEAGLC